MWDEFHDRAAVRFQSIISHPDSKRTVLAVSSVGPITVSLQTALATSIPVSLDLGWRLRNSSVTRFLYTANRLTLDGFNCSRASGKSRGDHVPLDVFCAFRRRRLAIRPVRRGGSQSIHVPFCRNELRWIFRSPNSCSPSCNQVRKFLVERGVSTRTRSSHAALPRTLAGTRCEARTVREMGLFTPQVPKEHGGAGLKFMEHALLSEELGRTPLGHFVFNCQAPDAGNMEILHEFGTPEQKEHVAQAADRGKDSQLLLDDGARLSGIESRCGWRRPPFSTATST